MNEHAESKKSFLLSHQINPDEFFSLLPTKVGFLKDYECVRGLIKIMMGLEAIKLEHLDILSHLLKEHNPEFSIEDSINRVFRKFVSGSYLNKEIFSLVDPGTRTQDGFTPLYFAIVLHPQLVDKFIKGSFSIDQPINPNNWTPLMVACKFNPPLIEKFISMEADIHKKCKNANTALIIATEFAPENVPYLLDKKANIHDTNQFGETPLTKAIRNNPNLVEFYLKLGANPNTQLVNSKENALMLAVKNNPQLVPLLLEAGANINNQNNHKNTALHYAIRHHVELIPFLIDHGADLTIINTENQSIEEYAQKTDNNAYEILYSCLEKRNIKDQINHTEKIKTKVSIL